MKKVKPKMGQIDYGIFYTVFLLLAIGVVMVYSASSYWAMFMEHDNMAYLKKQFVYAIIGLGAMFFMMRYDYHKIRKWTNTLLLICIPLLIATFFFKDAKGATRWIRLGPLSFQPSDLVKYVVVLFLASSLSRNGEKVKDFWKGIVPYLCISGFYAGIILLEKNLSIATIIMIVTMIMLFVAGGKKFHLFGIVTPALIAAASFFTLSTPYRRARLLNFIDPWKTADKEGYQLVQSFYALGAGGITGLGIGKSRQKTLYMPEPHNDFIFSIIGEELGLVGCVLIIILFIIFIFRGIRVAMNAKDEFGTLLAIGITSVIAVQVIINVAVVTGSMPVTGVPLPFISYGGSALVMNMMAVGVLLNISRQTNKKEF
ncbi:cell division protein FtsW [Clostridium cavendishii DSM 21758]|uniref:Probable peptidoglycan glycosyltransferase FtsW n=1 Tax=Clostridium cavendishii DSM 21758 TaxID=1121302 RepID=A0A1M6KPL8_9CLOT|nr:stage V sporulation protein E [Clostridium cavendishii]SHJ60870.1 cell division protein FtsW [Clostridium cavendishii DSM 21758]